MNIIIPTLGRIKTQITFNNLPARWKEKVQFIVQEHEYEDFCDAHGSRHVHKLPNTIDNIAATREWIYNNFKHDRYFVFDDDLEFTVKEPNKEGSPKWKSRVFNHKDFDDMFNTVNSWMDNKITHGGLGTTWVIPSIDLWPHADNTKIMTNVFYDGPNMPNNIEWQRVQYAEDFDVNLQLLTQGYANRVSTKYMVSPSDTNSEGGCSINRTLDAHNKSQEKLKELWPEYVRLKEKVTKTGPWKGKVKLGTVIQHKKAFKDGFNSIT